MSTETRKLPETVTATLYIVMPPYSDEPIISTSTMENFGYAILGQQEITMDVPQIDPRPQFIAALEKQAEKLKADHHIELKRIDDQIQSLLAIEHDGGEG